MTGLWLFLHFLGFVMWIGGGFASMHAGLAGKGEPRAGLGAITRAQARVQKMVIAPGALLVVLSGLILTMRFMGAMTTAMSPWLMAMQGAGLVGALITLMIGLPTASKLSRIDPEGQTSAYFDDLRKRMRISASLAGALALFALVAGVIYRVGG
ncbi:MAG TPA: hypothetical protein VK012_07150 [Gemmatimonadales bacterium]|nr:hypothetical protein [Gemmatimonadales bacterium]